MPRAEPSREPPGGVMRLAAVCALTLAGWSLVRADALDGVLEVRSAYVNIDKGVFLLPSFGLGAMMSMPPSSASAARAAKECFGSSVTWCRMRTPRWVTA